MNINRIQHILKECKLFEEFALEDLLYLAKQFSLRNIPTGTILFNQGDIGDFLFIVIDGNVEILVKKENNEKKVFCSLGYGDIVGEMSLIDDFPRSATVYAKEDSEILLLTRNKLDQINLEFPKIGLMLLKEIAKGISIRLRSVSERLVDIA